MSLGFGWDFRECVWSLISVGSPGFDVAISASRGAVERTHSIDRFLHSQNVPRRGCGIFGGYTVR